MKQQGIHVVAGGPACARMGDSAPDGRRSRGPERPLDPEVERWFATTGAAFQPVRSSTIPMLQAAQAALGYLPPDAMRLIARHLGVAPALIEGVASFYAQFRFRKPGLHRVTVCSGTACYVRGGRKLMRDLEVDLRIASGETTTDGSLSLESVACFGACALAPVVVLDDRVLRQQTTQTLKAVLADLSSSPAPGGPDDPSHAGGPQRGCE